MPLGNYHGSIQNFNSGSFQWLHTPTDLGVSRLGIARVTIRAGDRWPEHLHPNYEQALHVLSGHGSHSINGKTQQLHPGMTCYIPAGSKHEMTGSGSENLVYLAVYSPVVAKNIRHSDEVQPTPVINLRETISIHILQSIQDKVANSTELGVMMVDPQGRLLTQPTRMPLFCRLRCITDDKPDAPVGIVAAMQEAARTGGPYLGKCCFGVVIVVLPIMIENRCLGGVACGFMLVDEITGSVLEQVRQTASTPEQASALASAYQDLEVVLRTRIQAVAEALDLITTTVVTMAIDRARQREISKSHKQLALEAKVIVDLENSLSKLRMRIMEAHLNPHFLFNSLNLIADLIPDNPSKALGVLYSLSDFLRFALKEKRQMVPLHKEMKCLSSYVQIQSARFGDRLKFTHSLSPDAAQAHLPFMLLQPLVENAIVHGLAPKGYDGTIDVTVTRHQDTIEIIITDDGVGFDTDRLQMGPGGYGFGLYYVQQRLKMAFPQAHDMLFTSMYNEGTTVTITFPWQKERGTDAESIDS